MVYYIIKGCDLMKSKFAVMAEMFKALGDENRIKIMMELSVGEKNAGELLETLSVTQPTLSHHMKILCDSGIVEARKDGKWTYYSISKEGKEQLLDIINSFVTSKIKPSFKIEDIVIPAKEEKAEKIRKEPKKPAKKKVSEKKEKIEEKLIPVEEIAKEPEKVVIPEVVEEVGGEPEEERNRTMPSWLF